MTIRKPTFPPPDDYAPPAHLKPRAVPTTTISKFLTPEEIEKAVALYMRASPGSFARLCDERIIAPVLPRIEKALGQRMHPRYVAYMVEYAIGLSAHDMNKRRA